MYHGNQPVARSALDSYTLDMALETERARGFAEALRRLEAGEGDRSDVAAIVAGAGGLLLVHVHVLRRSRPRHGRRIELVPGGPLSTRPPVHVSGPFTRGGVWSARWRVEDLRAWLETGGPSPPA